MCFLDWQISRFVSPVIDLHHIIFTSTDKPLRDKEYKRLLDHYHLTLTRSIEKLGSDSNVFSRHDFDEHLRKFGSFAVIASIFNAPISMADSKDIPDLDNFSECLENDEKAVLVQDFGEATQLVYSKRVRDLVGDMYELGFCVKAK